MRSHQVDAVDADWLHLLVGDWQLISDLSFADLVLWVRGRDGVWVAAAHARPTTGVGVFSEDLVGDPIVSARSRTVQQAYDDRRIVRAGQTVWRGDTPVREEAIPVVRGGRVVAVMTRHTNLASMRTPSRLEVTYLATADALCRMICAGSFPQDGDGAGYRGAPRVGDGVLRIDALGKVTYASPNGVSAIHRLGFDGDLIGANLASVVRTLLHPRGPVDQELTQVLLGRAAERCEVQTRSATVVFRSIPLLDDGRNLGAVLLARDVSELRRRERELETKDVTIREIHHRVKNNLQTVAAVLRLQARRIDDERGRAALNDAVRRVATIAAVHETLSSRLDDHLEFDGIAGRTLQASLELGNRSGAVVRGRLEGSFGTLCSEDATALAMVLAELCQNAVEHGLAARASGEVVVAVRRESATTGDSLHVSVTDDGTGLPAGFTPQDGGLGVQIVRSLVSDLRGEITWERLPRGTAVRFSALLRDIPRAVG
ncbi:PAS domain-containing sensor histidine kinase [Calidifontibacter terrae]